MNPHTYGPSAVGTVIVIAAIAVGLALGTVLGLRVVTDDPAATGRTFVEAGVAVGIAADLLFMASCTRRLIRAYRRPS